MTVNSLHRVVCLVAAALLCLCGQSFGGVIAQYNVFSTSSGEGHGLWTSGDALGGGGANHQFWNATLPGNMPGMVFTQYNNGTSTTSDDYATLTGTVRNPQGFTATIDLMFNKFNSDWGAGHYKAGSGDAYNAANMDFFEEIDLVQSNSEGTTSTNTITFSSGQVINIDHHVSPYGFQFGYGANDKVSGELGGSAWIQSPGNAGHGAGDMTSHHWDLNLRFENVTGGGFFSVPEPTSAIVWSTFAMATLVQSRRRRRVA